MCDISNIESYYCHKKDHYKSSCPIFAAKQNGEMSLDNAQPKGEKQKHWTRVPPGDSDSPTKTVTTDGESAVFKWCKHCRRWRSGPKAHLTQQHKKKGSAIEHNGNTLQYASAGIYFGLFTGETTNATDKILPQDFVHSFFERHSAEPSQSSEVANDDENNDLPEMDAALDSPAQNDQAAVNESNSLLAGSKLCNLFDNLPESDKIIPILVVLVTFFNFGIK